MDNYPEKYEKLLEELADLKLENQLLKDKVKEAAKRELDFSLAEENLQKERLLLRTVIDNIPDSIYCKDTSGRKTLANVMELRLLGAAESEILGKTDFDFYPKEIAEGFLADDQFVLQTGQPVFNREEYLLDNNGQKQWLLTSKLPLKDETGKIIGIVGIGRNITDRKRVELALRESEEELRNNELLLRTVIDNIPDSIYCKDSTGRKTLANPMELRLSGVSSEADIIGKTDFDFYPKEIAEGFFADDQFVIQTGQPIIDREEYLFDKYGQKQWLLTSKLPLKDKEGNIIGIVGVGHNITSRKQADEEIKKQNEELSKTNAEKDKFFSIIAHDLKSPFQGLLGLTELIVMGEEDFTKEELLQNGKDIYDTASVVFKLIENLLEWAQMQKGSVRFTPKELDISTCIVQNIVVLKQRAMQKRITIKNEISDHEMVYADEKMVDTVLRNLLSNAVKFTRRDGEIVVTSKKIDPEMIEVSIHDTGIGMSEKDMKRLFKIEEKVSSKGTDGELSTGLGLLLCKEFVEKNGGNIWVESQEGKGSTFYFTLRSH